MLKFEDMDLENINYDLSFSDNDAAFEQILPLQHQPPQGESGAPKEAEHGEGDFRSLLDDPRSTDENHLDQDGSDQDVCDNYPERDDLPTEPPERDTQCTSRIQ